MLFRDFSGKAAEYYQLKSYVFLSILNFLLDYGKEFLNEIFKSEIFLNFTKKFKKGSLRKMYYWLFWNMKSLC